MIRSGMVRFHEALRPLLVPIDSVQPTPDNYNNGDVEEVMVSIETNGMYRAITTQDGFIRAGNTTWAACKELGAEVIPVLPLDQDTSNVVGKKIMVADNEIARKAVPDKGLLQAALDQIADAGQLMGSGYSDEELEALRALNDIPLDTQEFAQWPTFTVQVPPHVLAGFRYMTREADDDRQRFELILRLAGWDGH